MSDIISRLKTHVADFAIMYIKLHNYHWHVYGMDFKQIHELTETYYDEVSEAYDEIAERILQLGETAPASMKEYLELVTIKEESQKGFKDEQVIDAVKNDFEHLIKELQKTRISAAEKEDSSTDSILSDIIQGLEKDVWMLKAMLKK